MTLPFSHNLLHLLVPHETQGSGAAGPVIVTGGGSSLRSGHQGEGHISGPHPHSSIKRDREVKRALCGTSLGTTSWGVMWVQEIDAYSIGILRVSCQNRL